MTQPSRWTHPSHARGVKSQNLEGLFRGKKLTDAQIHAYCLAGKYGEAARLRAEAADALRVRDGKPKRRVAQTAESKHIQQLKDLIDDLTE